MKGKPIEPGCLAIIVGAVHQPKNNGKIVRVLRLKEEGYRPPQAPKLNWPTRQHNLKAWVVETLDGSASLQFVIHLYDRGKLADTKEVFVSERAVAESRLKRLDDGESYESQACETKLEKTA